MTIQVRVLGDPWVFDPMGAGAGAICIRRNDPNSTQTKVSLGTSFISHPQVNPALEVAHKI
jgi:hypothetical protein